MSIRNKGKLLLLCICSLFGDVVGVEGSNWLMRPYKVHIWYAPQSIPDVLERCDERFASQVNRILNGVFDRAWEIRVQVLPETAAFVRSARDPTFQEAIDVDPEIVSADKVFVVTIDIARSGFKIGLREFDCQVQSWGTTQRLTVAQPQHLGVRVADGLRQTFRPIARLHRVRQGTVTLEPRAGMLAGDGSPLLPEPQASMQPILCKQPSTADHNSKQIESVPLTVIVVESVSPERISGQLVSGLRAPLRTRSTRNLERFAISLLPTMATTRLRLRGRDGDGEPLVGYDVYAKPYGSQETTQVGRTDRHGELLVKRTNVPLQTLYVRHGARLMARLPMVAGAQAETEVQLTDDSLRFSVEGYLKGIEDRLIDAIVVRESHVQQAKRKLSDPGLDADGLKAALQLVDAARQHAQRRELNDMLRARQPEFRSSHPAVQRQIDRLFSKMRSAIQRGFDPAPLDQLSQEIDALSEQLRRRTVDPERTVPAVNERRGSK